MPRPPRINKAGVTYLVTCRAQHAQELLFKDEADYRAYLELLQDYRRRHGVTLLGYCLLSDHLHLYLEPTIDGTLSQFMHDLTTGYTKHVNKRLSRHGPLFQERYRAVAIEAASYLLPVTGYLHTHPVRSGAAATPDQYAFSSYRAYAGTEPDGGVDTQPALQQLAERGVGSYARYLSTLSAEVIEELRNHLAQPILGSEDFQAALRAPAPKPAVASVEPAPELARLVAPRAAQPRATMTIALLLISALALGAIGMRLATRLDGLEQTVRALSQENEADFRSRVTLAAHRSGLDSDALSLEDTAWDIRLVAINAAPSEQTLTDRLTFAEGRVASKRSMERRGSDGSYRLIVIPNGAVGWEAIQAEPSGALVSWEGQWDHGAMRGTMTRQAPGQHPESYTFIGVAASGADDHRSNI